MGKGGTYCSPVEQRAGQIAYSPGPPEEWKGWELGLRVCDQLMFKFLLGLEVS